MKRRDFVAGTAGLLGVASLRDLSAAIPCPPPAVSVEGGGTTQSECGATGQADWLARSTAAGVTFATSFDTYAETEAQSWRNQGTPRSPDPNTSRDMTGGVDGGPCMRMDIPITTAEYGSYPDKTPYPSWRNTLNRSWTQQSQGFGNSEFYVQFRFKFGAGFLTLSNRGGKAGGPKIALLGNYNTPTPANSAAQPNYQIGYALYSEDTYAAYSNICQPIVRQGDGVTSLSYLNLASEVSLGGSQYNQHPAQKSTDPYYCTLDYAKASTGQVPFLRTTCFTWDEGIWYTLYQRVKIASYGGSTGNELDVFVHKQGMANFAQLFASRDFPIGPTNTSGSVGDWSGGFSGLWLTPFETNRIRGNVTAYILYDQVIVSTRPIAVPII
jgi:hypothetical protein